MANDEIIFWVSMVILLSFITWVKNIFVRGIQGYYQEIADKEFDDFASKGEINESSNYKALNKQLKEVS